jgi:hypothetical protein
VIDTDARVQRWLAALDERHLADLTPSEVARALRALSSCYVERRGKLAQGGALDSAGKRAAFALFYGPLHFLTVREIAGSLEVPPLDHITDLGCGTGVGGAALALGTGSTRISGLDRNPWAVGEANRTYRDLGLSGRATQADVSRARLADRPGSAIVLAYTVNELPDAVRDELLPTLVAAHGRGVRILIVEPIARTIARWWSAWERAFAAGGRADEWRFPAQLPTRQRDLARAAGLDPRELTARSIWADPSLR